MGEDLSSFKQLYFKTANENIAALKMAIVKLTQNMTDTVAIEEIHRNAHTLKSKSIMMSYVQIGALSKAIEDLFYGIQKGTQQVSQPLITTLATAVTSLENCVVSIEANNPEISLEETTKKITESITNPIG